MPAPEVAGAWIGRRGGRRGREIAGLETVGCEITRAKELRKISRRLVAAGWRSGRIGAGAGPGGRGGRSRALRRGRWFCLAILRGRESGVEPAFEAREVLQVLGHDDRCAVDVEDLHDPVLVHAAQAAEARHEGVVSGLGGIQDVDHDGLTGGSLLSVVALDPLGRERAAQVIARAELVACHSRERRSMLSILPQPRRGTVCVSAGKVRAAVRVHYSRRRRHGAIARGGPSRSGAPTRRRVNSVDS